MIEYGYNNPIFIVTQLLEWQICETETLKLVTLQLLFVQLVWRYIKYGD